jgi:hypothetical protein
MKQLFEHEFITNSGKAEDIDTTLLNMSKNGWELVSVTSTWYPNGASSTHEHELVRMFFKRPIC